MTTQTSSSNWYANSYSTGFRSTRLRAPSLVPNSRIANQNALTPVQQTLVVDAARQGAQASDKDETKNVRRRETIFGPDVGEDDEPGWTRPEEGTKVSVDVVKGWVEKAKNEEGLHATTTLQALVNLKRPTLLLQQLGPDAEGDISATRPTTVPSAPLHSLKFNYDATTPDVHISLQVYPSPVPAVEGKESIAEEEVKTVYSGVHPGGFNQVFQLPASSALDLSSAVAPMPTESTIDLNDDTKGRDVSLDSNASSVVQGMGNMQLGHSSMIPELPTVPEGTQAQEEERPRRRFGLFGRRQRQDDIESAPIEMSNRTEEIEEEEIKEPERGMRLLIRIEALGPAGDALKRQNAQLTHILISGMWIPDAGSATGAGQGKRVWVVKVVRREAIIGAHTFLLKEIYGLSSASTGQGETSTSYPPTGGEADPYSSTPNECIVCLTSARDVVLLPCRHLVVCRDCAVGMVEFGAGGKVARREEVTAPEADATGTTVPGSATATGSAVPAPAPSGGTTTTGRERRKRKAKGWYCPVCRQPYTSLLRLALPSSKSVDSQVDVELSRVPSRASVRTTHSRYAPSIAPTLPRGAEEMLDRLRPDGARASDDEEEDEHVHDHGVVPESERPQFVLENEIDIANDDKREVEHQEQASSSAFDNAQQTEEGRGKGWKEAA